jgi:hypothetical protein
MPIETNLPEMVHIYLELINKITHQMTGFDSCTPETKIFMIEVEYYFTMIRQEMIKASEQV